MKTYFLLVFTFVLAAEVFPQARLILQNDPNARARSGQAEIIINTGNADRDIAVWVNGSIAAHVPPKSIEKIIVRNGQNVVELADTKISRGNWDIGSKKSITVNSNSDCTTIGMTIRYGALVNVSIQSTTALGGGPLPSAPSTATRPTTPAPSPAAAGTSSVETAVARAAAEIEDSIPDGAILAILSIASGDADLSEEIMEELTYCLVSTRKFTVVDRARLDSIRAETQFQMSGEVDDSSAVSIGNMLGASIVVTGGVTGTAPNRRLSVRALDVKTARIVGMARESF